MLRPLVALLLLPAALVAQVAQAQEPAAPEDWHSLQTAIEQQSKQLQALTEQVERLTTLLTAKTAEPAPAPQATPPATNPAETAPVSMTEAPRAEAVHPGPTHVVTKGETLTSIAKMHRVTVSDLLKANHIADDRKLQIGQTLQIPSPSPATTPPPQPSPTP